jgi:hypothetical protein
MKDNSVVEKLSISVDLLEKELDQLILDDKIKTQQIKKLYKENDLLKKKYQIILEKISKYVDELESLKRNYGKD